MSEQTDASAAWQSLGEAIGNAFFYLHIQLLIIAAVLVLLAILVTVYLRKRKSNKNTGNEKGYVPLRISIIVVIGALVLLTFPMLVGFFL